MRRTLIGAALALVCITVLAAVMVPLRPHLSIATSALGLLVPVVVGAAVGGIWAGVTATVAGFLVFDLLFVPPYDTLAVAHAEYWVALAVYAVIAAVVARVVAGLQGARAEALRRETDTRRVSVLSDLLISDKPLPELLQLVADTIHDAFGPTWVAVLLPGARGLEVVATAGEPITPQLAAQLAPVSGRLQRVGLGNGVLRITLATTTGPVGLLAMSPGASHHDPQLLHIYVNQAAMAIERAQLRDRALRAQLLEEADRWRAALLGAVSHDLRTPLASVKAAVTALRDNRSKLTEGDRRDLLELIEQQSDNLARLVTNLLDMTRLEAGAVVLHRDAVPVGDLVEEALAALGASAPPVVTSVSEAVPPVEVDQVLMVQVLANLLQNAGRHSPDGAAVEVTAEHLDSTVAVSVRDHGPGVPVGQRDQIFHMVDHKVDRSSGTGRAGLGLTIAKAFVDAHGGTIRSEDAPGGGARFVFTVPCADVPADVA